MLSSRRRLPKGGFLMSKIALAIGLAGLLLATASTKGSAMPIVPLSKSAISGPSSDLDLVRWRNCWRDRWGKSSLQLVLARSLGTRSLRVSAPLKRREGQYWPAWVVPSGRISCHARGGEPRLGPMVSD